MVEMTTAMKEACLSLGSGVLIILLFPGYFLYHAAVATGVIPPVLGGFIGQVAVLFGLPLLLLNLADLVTRREKSMFIDYAVLLYSAFLICWTSIYYLFGTGVQTFYSYYYYNIAAIFLWLAVYFGMRNLNLDDKWMRIVLAASLPAFLVVAASNSEGLFFDAGSLSGEVEFVSDYQGFARSAVVVALLLLTITRGVLSAAVFAVAIPLLFILGARSEFVGFIFVGSAFILLREGVSRVTVLWVPAGLLFLGYLAYTFDVLGGESRILELLKISQDGSYQARGQLMSNAIKTLVAHPLLGDYASQLYQGDIGEYAHNGLSAWVSYGLAGFAGFAFLLGYGALQSLGLARHGGLRSPRVATALIFSMYAIFLAITAKSVNDPIFAVAWGAVACVLADRRRRHR